MQETLFCTECGQKLVVDTQFCTNCGAPVRQIPPPSSKEQQLEDIQIIRHCAHWEIPQNVIGRRISPKDFENLPNLKGLIIQKGVSAFVYIDGAAVSEKRDGLYEFISQAQIDNYLEKTCEPGKWDWIKNKYRAACTWIFGKKLKNRFAEKAEADLKSIKTIDDLLAKLRPNSSIEIYLLSDNPFTTIFHSFENNDGSRSFQPFTIQCRNLSIDIALKLQFRISDQQAVIQHFLSNQTYLSTYTIEERLSSRIRSLLEAELQSADINEYGISDAKRLQIESRLKGISDYLPGIELSAVLDITTSNEEFKRLRQISDELFVSEKELEAAIRANDFRNKLAAVENQARIDEAQNGLALYKALAEIDKDKTLHQEELDQFYMLVSRQRMIREAQNEEEIRKAFEDLKRSKLLSEDDSDALLRQLADKKLEREALSEIMNMQHLANVEMKRMDIENLLADKRYNNQLNALRNSQNLNSVAQDYERAEEIKKLEHAEEALRLELSGKRRIDAYMDERNAKAREDFRDDVMWQENLEWQKKERRNEDFKSMMGFLADQHEREEESKHKREMERMKSEQSHLQEISIIQAGHEEKMRSIEANMTSDQILASRQDLNAEAQVEFAKAMGSQKILEAERSKSEKIEQLLRAQNERDYAVFRETRDLLAGLTRDMIGSQAALREDRERLNEDRYRSQVELAREYREEKRQAQERQDNYSRHLMEHEEKLQTASIGTINAMSGKGHESASQPQLIKCPCCGQQVRLGKFCGKCGSELSITGNQ